MTARRPSRRGLGTEGLKPLFFVLYPLLAIVVVPIAVAGASTGLRGNELFNDPAYELGVLWGIFSYFGILMWAASTACCAVAWTFLTRTSPSHRLRPWFLASAVLSGALTIDDTFLMHDLVLSDYVGIPEVIVLLGYAAAIGWYFIRFRRELLDRADSTVFLGCPGGRLLPLRQHHRGSAKAPGHHRMGVLLLSGNPRRRHGDTLTPGCPPSGGVALGSDLEDWVACNRERPRQAPSARALWFRQPTDGQGLPRTNGRAG
jgi:hypothetical protein